MLRLQHWQFISLIQGYLNRFERYVDPSRGYLILVTGSAQKIAAPSQTESTQSQAAVQDPHIRCQILQTFYRWDIKPKLHNPQTLWQFAIAYCTFQATFSAHYCPCHQARSWHTNAQYRALTACLCPRWLLGTTDTIKFLIRAPAPDIKRTPLSCQWAPCLT